MLDSQIQTILSGFSPITLQQMSAIRLMNRTDTKFVTTKRKLVELLQMAGDDYYVQAKDNQCITTYRTVYYDTEECGMYLAHHNGRLTREKIRVRTYMDTGDTFLEVKNKNNHGRTDKKRMKLENPDCLPKVSCDPFLEKHALYLVDDLHRKMENQFERITLVNRAMTERLTIDTNIHFHHFDTDGRAFHPDLVIVELKRDGNVWSPVRNMLRDLRIQPQGFSKYCIGSAFTNVHLKQNRFKPRMMRIHKILTS